MEAIWIAVGQAASIIGTLVGIRVLTQLLSPSQYGHLALGLTASALASQVVWGPLVAGATRFYAPASEAGQLRVYLGVTSRFSAFGVAFLTLLAVLAAIVAAVTSRGQWIPLIVSGVAYSVVTGFDSIASGIQTAARQRAIVAVHSGIASWARLLCAVAVMWILGVSSTSALWGFVLGTALVLLSQYRFFGPVRAAAAAEDSSAESAVWARRLHSYSWPFVLWGGFGWFQLASDRWALALFSTASEVGVYSVLYQLSYAPIALLAGMLITLVGPIIFRRAGDAGDAVRLSEANALTRRIVLYVLIGTFALFAVWLGLHGWVFSVLTNASYARASSAAPWMVLSAGLFAAGQVLALDRLNRLESHELIVPKVVTALAGGLLNILGAYLHGIYGLVAASLTFSAVYLLWLLLLRRR